ATVMIERIDDVEEVNPGMVLRERTEIMIQPVDTHKIWIGGMLPQLVGEGDGRVRGQQHQYTTVLLHHVQKRRDVRAVRVIEALPGCGVGRVEWSLTRALERRGAAHGHVRENRETIQK